jgi:molecular chaperone DnaK (HSP70)
MSVQEWVLAIDFGTSNTTAAHGAVGGTPAILQVENSQYLPSMVVADGDGQLLTGRAATQQAAVFPERTARVPKQALASGNEAVLGGLGVPATDLVGAVLGRAYQEAVRFHDGVHPSQVVLTYPVRWSQAPLARLTAAAARTTRSPEARLRFGVRSARSGYSDTCRLASLPVTRPASGSATTADERYRPPSTSSTCGTPSTVCAAVVFDVPKSIERTQDTAPPIPRSE